MDRSQPSMSRVYIGNLPPGIAEEDLNDAFSRYGRIRSTWVARKPPGFAFLEFEDQRDAEDACKSLDGHKGWKVELSRRGPRQGGGGGGGGGGRYGGGGGYSRGGYGGGGDGGFDRGRSPPRRRSLSPPRRRRSPSYDRDRRRSPSYDRDRRRDVSRSPVRRDRSRSPAGRRPSPPPRDRSASPRDV